MKNLILVGDIIHNFNEDGTPKKYTPAKFILISTDGIEYQMLLHNESHPFQYHAQAVLKHMQDNGLDELYVYGGAKISLGTVSEILAHGKSYAFGTPNDEILSKVISGIWPSHEIQISTSRPKISEPALYSISQVQHFADNP